ncbi:MAG: 4-alpha-glucanotransferase [Marinilabiliales bacterium]|nr:4-alpha-glucanotransferase [Marinilabiliales bacterium]
MQLNRRKSGILLHPSALPGPSGIGTLGEEAYAFVDWLAAAGQKIWQILPLGPTDFSHSPYQSFSAFAGNPNLIDLDLLAKEGLLETADLLSPPDFPKEKIDYPSVLPYREKLLWKAYQHFRTQRGFDTDSYHQFSDQHGWWLDSWSLFDACRRFEPGTDWSQWRQQLRDREQEALEKATVQYGEQIGFSRFLQYQFMKQWFALKSHANQKGIAIFGDIPLYVAFNSADVWSNPSLFLLDDQKQPTSVGGVPPDYFSKTGQRWGNPLFNWDRMADQGFAWWMARLHFNLRLFDLIRIDHFRGLEAFWAIPATDKTAIHGSWMKARGDEMLQLLQQQIGSLPIVAEDLGLITEEVDQLRRKYGLPGMKVLQFAFSGEADNPHLPHNHERDFVAYTGTHDNTTTAGWLQGLKKAEKRHLCQYLGKEQPDCKNLVAKALESTANVAILPIQDVLALPAAARMNKPGTIKGNWIWRLNPNALGNEEARTLRELTELYGRR